MRLLSYFVGCGMLVGAAGACASDRQVSPPPNYQELQQQELAAERQEYISETNQRLSEVNQEIDHLDVKLQHESKFVDESQKASWSQELFELKQERDQLQAQLQRADTASPEEWQQMRGNIGVATDSLQAGVRKLTSEVAQLFSSDGESEARTGRTTDSVLCPVEVAGIEAEVQQQQNQLLLSVTTDNDEQVPELQRRANELAKSIASYPASDSSAEASSDAAAGNQAQENPGTQQQAGGGPASGTGPATSQPSADASSQANQSGSTGAAGTEAIQVKVSAQNIEDGVKLVFVPQKGDMAKLRERVEKDAQQLGKGVCDAGARVSARETQAE